ncbi:hypothetical protein DFJ74DRAFT_763786 [Hyaloraphidium curvatum]|nr:hypothetical protein DFJ74DRAFT_763786 [Hyaloraphidium curvatum]
MHSRCRAVHSMPSAWRRKSSGGGEWQQGSRRSGGVRFRPEERTPACSGQIPAVGRRSSSSPRPRSPASSRRTDFPRRNPGIRFPRTPPRSRGRPTRRGSACGSSSTSSCGRRGTPRITTAHPGRTRWGHGWRGRRVSAGQFGRTRSGRRHPNWSRRAERRRGKLGRGGHKIGQRSSTGKETMATILTLCCVQLIPSNTATVGASRRGLKGSGGRQLTISKSRRGG